MEQTLKYAAMETDPTRRVEIDLGCGEGSFSAELARSLPHALVVAVDTMRGRLDKLRRKAAKLGLGNLVVVESEAGFFLHAMLAEASADSIHLLCPDPWPKAKHRFHRLVSGEFADSLRRKLKPGGLFHFSSDDAPYCDAVERIMASNPQFKPTSLPENLKTIRTDFELQWLSQGKNVEHLCWRSEPCSGLK